MKLQVIPIDLESGRWYVLKVIRGGVEMYYSDYFTLQETLRINSDRINVVKYRNPEKFQSILKKLIPKFRWNGMVHPHQELEIVN